MNITQLNHLTQNVANQAHASSVTAIPLWAISRPHYPAVLHSSTGQQVLDVTNPMRTLTLDLFTVRTTHDSVERDQNDSFDYNEGEFYADQLPIMQLQENNEEEFHRKNATPEIIAENRNLQNEQNLTEQISIKKGIESNLPEDNLPGDSSQSSLRDDNQKVPAIVRRKMNFMPDENYSDYKQAKYVYRRRNQIYNTPPIEVESSTSGILIIH